MENCKRRRKVGFFNWWTNPETGEVYTDEELMADWADPNAKMSDELKAFLEEKRNARSRQKKFMAMRYARERKLSPSKTIVKSVLRT